jgi:hypothetical protein
MTPDAQRRQELRRLWLERPETKRSDHDLLLFHGWVEPHRPELLKAREHGDPLSR